VRGPTRLISATRGAVGGIIDLGYEPPIVIGREPKEAPVARAVSPRWLAGTILTGFTSIFLMGGALMVALNNPNQFASLPESISAALDEGAGADSIFGRKGDRMEPTEEQVSSRQLLQVSTVTRQGERDFIKLRPFAKVTATLVPPKPDMADKIPAYDALRLFADNTAPQPSAPTPAGQDSGGSDQIYGADVDGEVSVKVADFPADEADIDLSAALDASAVEQVVRSASGLSIVGDQQAQNLGYADAGAGEVDDPSAADGVKIVQENVSNVAKNDGAEPDHSLEEKFFNVANGDTLRAVLARGAVDPADADAITTAMSGLVDLSGLHGGQKVRLAFEPDSAGIGGGHPIRVSLYDDGAHQATVARTDNNAFVRADAPAPIPENLARNDTTDEPVGGMPRIYDAVYETALEQQIPPPLIDQIIRIFAFDVDFQSRILPGDSLEVFHSLPDAQDRDAGSPEILFAALTIGGQTKRFYRFRTPDDGVVDYYDEEGRSAKKFLMRKPAAAGIIRSGFGWRVHPILGYRRLHAGVDYAAPKGTPIFAAGNGIVEKAGRSSGYGNFTLIKHTNGYETAYGHQSAFAKGIAPGTRVRQGQIIGYIGSTGLSTGPHLHFEIRVNGKPVDPLRIRLPRGRVLAGDLLQNFEHERERIDTLLGQSPPAKVAQASN
jgi:murein DD-endopeptidase MepM/ murein hydrolase activator NlpD